VLLLPGPVAKRGQATDVILPAGQRLPQIARRLVAAGVIRAPAPFLIAAEALGAAHSLKAGEYSFESQASLYRVLQAIRSGKVVRHFVTIPEGLTSAAAAAIVAAQPELTGAAPVPPEGSLLPETYEVTRGESRAQVLLRMQTARDALLARLWDHRDPNSPYRDPEQAVVLASIVEKETALAQERPRIAAVFLNRLARGMRLDSDPTVVYGITGGARLGHGLRVSELRGQTNYNTYVIAGLPPTPIANPGRAALQAALNPAPSEDLYFVANGTGGHAFASTLAMHRKNVDRWRAIERARGPRGG
jgi:UPF0755 protein